MNDNKKQYLSIGSFKDLTIFRERAIYRFFEMLPGIFIWATFAFAIFFSWASPIFVAFFILAFDLYWIFKVLYFSIHTPSQIPYIPPPYIPPAVFDGHIFFHIYPVRV